MAVSLHDSYVPGADVVFRELEGEGVLLDLQTGTYFGLDATGTRMWQLIAEHRVLDRVVAALAREFDAPAERLAGDLVGLVTQLEGKRLMRRERAR